MVFDSIRTKVTGLSARNFFAAGLVFFSGVATAQTALQTTDWNTNCNGCHGSLATISARINAANSTGIILAARTAVASMATVTTNATILSSVAGYIEAKYLTATTTAPNTNYDTVVGPVDLSTKLQLGTTVAALTTLQTIAAPSCGTVAYSNVVGAPSVTYTPRTGVTPCAVGTYTLTYNARNAGSTLTTSNKTVSFTVVAVVPSAPTIGTATLGNAQATVAFTASSSTGGSAILDYTATSSPGGFTGTCAASPCTVTGLTNGTAYTFTVRARNALGFSLSSGASNSVTPRTVPGAPTIGLATPANTQVSVAFTAPASTGGSAITSYAATSSPSGLTGACAASPCTVSGLLNGTAYTFTVTATNAAGTGAASAVSVAVTPRTVPGAPTIGTAALGNAQATVAFTAPASTGGSAITGYTATSNPSGLTGTCGASPCTVPGLTNGTTYTFTVTASNIAGTGAASAASNSVIPRTVPGAPTIGTATAGNLQASVAFAAPASNGGNAITLYTATSSPSGITGTCVAPCVSINVSPLVNFTPYTFTVTATNAAGTGAASAASNSVAPVPTPVPPTFTSANNATFVVSSPGSFNVTASGTPSAMTFTPTGALPTGVTLTATGVLSGTPALGTAGSYPFTIKADNTTGPAAIQSFTLTVSGIAQSISFTGPATQTFGAAPVALTATATSGLAVSFTTVPVVSSVCSVSGSTVTLTSAGTCTIAADQNGNTSFAPAPQVTRAFTINQATQATLIANAVATVLPFGGTTTLSTTGGSGTGAVTFVSNNGNCSIAGTTLTATGAGSCVVTATKAADTNFLIATGTIGITINQASQAVLNAFAMPSSISFGATSMLSTSGGSGTGSVSYASSNANCSIAGATLTGAAAGSCTVTATKAADANFTATSATVNVTVAAIIPGAPTIGTATATSGQVSIAFTPPASDGGSAITGYTAACAVGGTIAGIGTATSSPVVVSGLTNGTSYNCAVRATNNAGAGPVSGLVSATPFSQGPTLWTNLCSGCHGATPAGNRFNAAGLTGNVLNYVRQTQLAMASISEIQSLTATDLADIAAYILDSLPPISVTTRFNTPKAISVSSQITLNTISFTNIQITGNPANGTLSAPSGTTITYTPNLGYVGTDTFTYRGVGAPASPGTLFGEDRTITIQILMAGIFTVPAAPAIGTATPGGSKATITFTPSSDDGGSPVTGYTVTCNSGGPPITATGPASPITVTGLTDAVFYFCSVTATNTMGTSTPSATTDVIPQPRLLTALSRKTHGAAGTFDIVLDTSQLIGGFVTTESRASDAGGTGHQVVFQFDGPIAAPGTPDVVDALGNSIGSIVSAIANGNNVEVTFTGIADNTRANVTLSNVNNASNPSVAIGFLAGDANDTRAVTPGDIASVKARSGQTTNATNFRFDINASGSINASDIAAVKARSGLVLP
jgi:hypothetical protein